MENVSTEETVGGSIEGIGTLSRVQQSVNSVICIGTKGQKGILKPFVADIAINLWGHDLLQQWNTQINIPPVSDTNYVQSLDSSKDLVIHNGKRLPTIHAVQKLGTNDGPSEEPKALPLKWLPDETVWVGQWLMTSEKLEALEKLVQEQLDAGHIEESTSPWNSPVFVIKKKSGKWRTLKDLRAINKVQAVVAHTFNTSTCDTEADGPYTSDLKQAHQSIRAAYYAHLKQEPQESKVQDRRLYVTGYVMSQVSLSLRVKEEFKLKEASSIDDYLNGHPMVFIRKQSEFLYQGY
ncbi:Pol polyprotein [Cricetulus griseus]|nr:Pol polyprotein [Cricetulus griseus]